MRPTDRAAALISCVALCAAMLFGIASAPVAARIPAGPAVQPVAVLTVISGDVLLRTASGDFTSAMDGTVLYVGAVLRTSADARALITLVEGSIVELDPASDITIESTTAGGGTFAQALGRWLRVVMHLTTADSRYEPTTPAATASVRGIDFETAVASRVGALWTPLMPIASVESPSFTTPTSWRVVAPTRTTTERANPRSVSTRASRERNPKVLRQTLAPHAPSSGRSRDGDGQSDRDEEDRAED